MTISYQDQQNFFMENLKNLLTSSQKVQFDWVSEKQGKKEIKNFGVSRIQFCIQHDDLNQVYNQGQGGNIKELNKSQILLSFKDFQKCITTLSKESENFQFAQLSLAVFIFYPQKVCKSDFKKQIMDCTLQIQQNGFISETKVHIYEIENLPKISQENKILVNKMMEQQMTQQNFIEDMNNLKTQSLANAEFKIYSLAKIILYRCGEIKDIEIKNENLQFFGQFNWYLRKFKQSLLEVYELLKECSKNEYSQKSQKNSRLSTISSLEFVQLIINDLPIISQEIHNEVVLQQKHIQSLLCDLYVPLFIKNIQSYLSFLTQKHFDKFQDYFQIKFSEANLTGKEAFTIIYNGLLQIIGAKSFEQNFKIKVAEQFVQQIVPYSNNEKKELNQLPEFKEIDVNETKQFLSKQFANEFQNKKQILQSDGRIGKRNQPESSDYCIDLAVFQDQHSDLKKRNKKAKQKK